MEELKKAIAEAGGFHAVAAAIEPAPRRPNSQQHQQAEMPATTGSERVPMSAGGGSEANGVYL